MDRPILILSTWSVRGCSPSDFRRHVAQAVRGVVGAELVRIATVHNHTKLAGGR